MIQPFTDISFFFHINFMLHRTFFFNNQSLNYSDFKRATVKSGALCFFFQLPNLRIKPQCEI